MKIQLSILFMIVCGSACHHNPAAVLKETPSQVLSIVDSLGIDYNNLTNQDRSKYVLHVEFVSEGDDSCSGSAKHFYKLLAVLQNRSEDTLKYLDWTCSHMNWYTDSKLVWANEQKSTCIRCIANFISTFQIPPHQSKRIELMAAFRKDKHPVTTQFRVGMILQRVIIPTDWDFYFKQFINNRMENLHHQTKNLIWSNIVQISI